MCIIFIFYFFHSQRSGGRTDFWAVYICSPTVFIIRGVTKAKQQGGLQNRDRAMASVVPVPPTIRTPKTWASARIGATDCTDRTKN